MSIHRKPDTTSSSGTRGARDGVSTEQTPLAISIDDVRSAADRIRDDVIRTPVVSAPSISEALETEVFFKCENLQHGGAFKARGACNAVFALSKEDAAAGVVAHSSGNHAAALARAARIRRIPAHIVMPHNSAAVKIAAVRRLGVEPVFSEPDAASRQKVADEVIARTGATFIHPFNNPYVMAGQGTTALEFLEQVPDLDALLVPVGGGGLLSGCLTVANALQPELSVFAAEPEWADDVYRSLASGQIEEPTRYDTIADGLRTQLGDLTFPIVRALLDEVLLTSEDEIRAAATELIQSARLMVEPSGAVALAALTSHIEQFRGRRVGIIISGGNADPDVTRSLLGKSANNLQRKPDE